MGLLSKLEISTRQTNMTNFFTQISFVLFFYIFDCRNRKVVITIYRICYRLWGYIGRGIPLRSSFKIRDIRQTDEHDSNVFQHMCVRFCSLLREVSYMQVADKAQNKVSPVHCAVNISYFVCRLQQHVKNKQ